MFNAFLFNEAQFNGILQAGAAGVPLSMDRRTITLPAVGLTKVGIKIKNFVIGDRKGIDRIYTGLLPGTTIDKAWLTVKKKEKDADANALIRKIITTIDDPAGVISQASTSDGKLAMRFDVDMTESALAKPLYEYYYDVQVKTDEGGIHTLEIGTMTFIRGYTAAAA